VFDFDEQERAKKVRFIAHLENVKGEKGPWGPPFGRLSREDRRLAPFSRKRDEL
jgi:hypothetical protein